MSTDGLRGRLLRALLAASVGLGAHAAAGSQTFDVPPQPGPARALNIDAPTERSLPNGMRVVLAERRGVQLVTARLVVLSGSEADSPALAGLASLTAGLLTKGTRAYSATALVRAAESLGGALESSAGWHQTEVAITVSTPKLDEALGLVSETVQHPRFAPAELDRLRAQALDELKVAYAEPGTLATLSAQHLLYGAGAYGHPSGGTPASLQRIRRADVLALHAAQSRPDRAVLVLAGDIDAERAMRLAERHFGGWKPARGVPSSAPAPSAGSALPMPAAVIDMPQAGQAAVVLAVPVPRLGADRAAAAVLNSVLGGGFSSRLSQEIRIKRGLSYGAFSQLDARPLGGALRLVVQTKNESAAEVAGLLQGELDRLVTTPVGDDELAARKATLIGDFSRGVETTGGLGAAVRSLIVAGLPSDDLRKRIDSLAAVSASDVQRFAAANFAPERRRLVVAGEAARFAEALKATATGLVTVPAAALDLERRDGLRAR